MTTTDEAGASGLRVAVESWAPGYGSALRGDEELVVTHGDVDVGCEVAAAEWAPRTSGREPATDVVFVDGVRRVDAQLWISDQRGTRPGLAVSLAAGLICCDGAATVGPIRLRRGVVGQAPMPELPARGTHYQRMHVAGDTPDALLSGVQDRLGSLEQEVAARAPEAQLTVLDGPLPDGAPAGAIGYVKSHHMAYLPDAQATVVGRLSTGERTPLFMIQTNRSRYSWYLRLPGAAPGHPWSGVVRCEAAADMSVQAAAGLAELSAASLPRFASQPHKDARAPQNLYPIAGLERRLRRLLGDAELLERALRTAVRRL